MLILQGLIFLKNIFFVDTYSELESSEVDRLAGLSGSEHVAHTIAAGPGTVTALTEPEIHLPETATTDLVRPLLVEGHCDGGRDRCIGFFKDGHGCDLHRCKLDRRISST